MDMPVTRLEKKKRSERCLKRVKVTQLIYVDMQRLGSHVPSSDCHFGVPNLRQSHGDRLLRCWNSLLLACSTAALQPVVQQMCVSSSEVVVTLERRPGCVSRWGIVPKNVNLNKGKLRLL